MSGFILTLHRSNKIIRVIRCSIRNDSRDKEEKTQTIRRTVHT